MPHRANSVSSNYPPAESAANGPAPSPSGIEKLIQWWKRRTQHQPIMQWISYVMIFSALVVFLLEYPAGRADWRFYGTVLCLSVLLLVNVLWYQSHDELLTGRQRIISHWGFNIVTDLLTLGAIALSGRSEVVFLIFMQVSQFAFMFGVWPVGVLYSLINMSILMGILKSFGVSNGNLITTASEVSIGLIFVLVFTLLVDRSSHATERAERLLGELQAAHADLQAAQQKDRELAVAEERVRLARDIHDGLGHHLTVLSIQLQAAEKLVARNPAAAAESIRLSRAETQAALEEVRRSVAVMRASPEETRPLEEALSDLVRAFGERTGLETAFAQSGNAPELSAFARQTLFRAAQEGLTNAQKHGRDVTRIRVALDYGPDAVRLVVRDNGRTAEPAAPAQTGYGLTGIRERAKQLGGELQSGAAPGGYTLELRIPLREAARD